jgi:hypothetical protein
MPPGSQICSCTDACEEFSEPASTPQGARAPMDCSERRPLRRVQRVRIRRRGVIVVPSNNAILPKFSAPELYLVAPCVRVVRVCSNCPAIMHGSLSIRQMPCTSVAIPFGRPSYESIILVLTRNISLDSQRTTLRIEQLLCPNEFLHIMFRTNVYSLSFFESAGHSTEFHFAQPAYFFKKHRTDYLYMYEHFSFSYEYKHTHPYAKSGI